MNFDRMIPNFGQGPIEEEAREALRAQDARMYPYLLRALLSHSIKDEGDRSRLEGNCYIFRKHPFFSKDGDHIADYKASFIKEATRDGQYVLLEVPQTVIDDLCNDVFVASDGTVALTDLLYSICEIGKDDFRLGYSGMAIKPDLEELSERGVDLSGLTDRMRKKMAQIPGTYSTDGVCVRLKADAYRRLARDVLNAAALPEQGMKLFGVSSEANYMHSLRNPEGELAKIIARMYADAGLERNQVQALITTAVRRNNMEFAGLLTSLLKESDHALGRTDNRARDPS